MKKPPRSYGFQERLDYATGHAPDPESVFPFLKALIPNFKCMRKAPKANDKSGTDFLIERHGLFTLQMDLKLRDEDYSVKPEPYGGDDLALETFSVIERGVPGWTRDATKTTDYVWWFWKDTGRYFIVPFPPLCAVFDKHWREWRKQFKTRQQRSEWGPSVWHSECVFVPRALVMQEMNSWSNGWQVTQAAG